MTKVKRNIRFNFIDILIIAAIIAMALVGYKIVTGKSLADKKSDKNVTFTVELKGVERQRCDAIKVGDKILNANTDDYLGTVEDVQYKKGTAIVESKQDGRFVESEYQDKYDVYITISGSPAVSETDIKIGDQVIKIGASAAIRSKNYSGSGFIVEMDYNDGGVQ